MKAVRYYSYGDSDVLVYEDAERPVAGGGQGVVQAAGGARKAPAAPAEPLAAAPRTVELADAAALPSVGLTAWQALFEHAGLRAGQSILVNGAGGAVGGYAVPLAQQ